MEGQHHGWNRQFQRAASANNAVAKRGPDGRAFDPVVERPSGGQGPSVQSRDAIQGLKARDAAGPVGQRVRTHGHILIYKATGERMPDPGARCDEGVANEGEGEKTNDREREPSLSKLLSHWFLLEEHRCRHRNLLPRLYQACFDPVKQQPTKGGGKTENAAGGVKGGGAAIVGAKSLRSFRWAGPAASAGQEFPTARQRARCPSKLARRSLRARRMGPLGYARYRRAWRSPPRSAPLRPGNGRATSV